MHGYKFTRFVRAGRWTPICLLVFTSLLHGPVAAQKAVTYYVDSLNGSNANPGTSVEAPWRDFTNVNGKVLGPGERLLIKRGSVICQELRIGAKGTPEQWAEIGAYGEGARPILRRNWQIHERCGLIRNPDFLRIFGLTFSYAGKGMVVYYAEPGHGGLLIEDCVAHHIEGIYREWGNLSGIPEWTGYKGSFDDGFRASSGIAVTGRGRDITIRNCDIFQTSWGFFVTGERVRLDRVNVHDCYVYNTSPHPALITAIDSVMENCVFDAPGYHAFAGTMGIMLGNPLGLAIRNCTFRNQPDSGSHDEGAIDFEANGDGCLIDGCTFMNNAGAAIEVLGLRSPQAKNIEIRNSRFIKNNGAKKLGPAEIFVWGGKKPDPAVACSTGTIHDNGYVLAPGVAFFVNQAPDTTQWTLRDNTAFASREALDRAMPLNNPPVVSAGPDQVTGKSRVGLRGTVSDDKRPAGKSLKSRWELLEGPGTVNFADADSPGTGAVFSTPGDYLLRLVADDGELWTSDLMYVGLLPGGVSPVKTWEFNGVLDKEGWTEADLGTAPEYKKQVGTALPVHYVAGGYYILAVKEAPNAHILSPGDLGLPAGACKVLRLRFQNHTAATAMKLHFITTGDSTWDDAKSLRIETASAHDQVMETVVDLSAKPSWKGTVEQLRINLTGGDAVTGTIRIDSIRFTDG